MQIAALPFAVAMAAQLTTTATISVRVVDTTWAPLPGAVTRVDEVTRCWEPSDVTASLGQGYTNTNGVVQFGVKPHKSYRIATEIVGYESQTTCILSNASTAYVQLRVREDLSNRVQLRIPAKGSVDSTGAVISNIVGVYAGPSGSRYEVTLLEGSEGVEVSFPDGRVAQFPQRRGMEFSGPSGNVRFDVAGGLVTMSVTSAVVKAEKALR